MCSAGGANTAMMPFGMKLNGQSPYLALGSPHLSLELQRAQLQDYTHRLQLGIRSYPGQVAGINPLSYHSHLVNPYLHPYFYKDPRARFIHEEPKPNHSYIGLIAMAILGSRDKKLVLSDIYQWILDNYSYFRTRGPGWRNSIRHNLSLNDCFIKAGRSANGKGHYWAIHPANYDDFQKGDFRRRRAQRRVRKHMGLSVPDDDDDDSPAPSPTPLQSAVTWEGEGNAECAVKSDTIEKSENNENSFVLCSPENTIPSVSPSSSVDITAVSPVKRVKRLFDVESLLAPDSDADIQSRYKKHIKLSIESPPSRTHELHDVDLSDREINENLDKSDGSEKDSIESPKKDDVYVRHSNSEHDSTEGQDNVYSSPSFAKASDIFGHQTLSPLVPGLQLRKPGDTEPRMSAFRNTGQYVWSSLPGYLSNYHHLMSINAGGGHPLAPQGTNIARDSVQRWHHPISHIPTQTDEKEEDDTKTINVSDD